MSLEDLIVLTEPSVVVVRVDTSSGTIIGSGFVVDDRGTIATNYHVVEEALAGRVELQDKSVAEIVGVVAMDPGKDVALLRVALPVGKVRPLQLAAEFRKGEAVAAFGAPMGFSYTVSQGIISAVRSGSEVRAFLVEETGADTYAQKGLGDDALWIQTTAAISPGNSGGPLVRMNGEVAGMNSWARLNAQSVNFAASAASVRRLMGAISPRPRPLPLAARPATSMAGASYAPNTVRTIPRGFGRIDLPSGAVLSDSTVAVPANWMTTMFPSKGSVYVGKYASDAVQGVFSYEEGKLHGASASLDESGVLRALVNYESADRHGPLRLWDEAGRMTLYEEYRSGNKHGLCSVFQEGAPWLIQEWQTGKMLDEYLVRSDSGKLTPVPARQAAADALSELGQAQLTLRQVKNEFDESERTVKQGILKWYAQEKKRLLQERVSALAPAKREARRQRGMARDASKTAAHDAFWRESLKRSGIGN